MSDCKLSQLKFLQLRLLQRHLAAIAFTSSLLVMSLGNNPVIAQTTAYCQESEGVRQEKESLLQKALQGDTETQNRYKQLINQQAQQLAECRDRTPPQHQAIWLRLYPCDTQPGVLDKIMDRIVSRGYNYVYIETFADGQVLLPASANPTAWPAMVRTPGTENTDLLAEAIQKAHERGLKVYAWMFMMNFGYSYGQRSDRQSVLARNFQGDTSLNVVDNASQVFIDPYNVQAKRDFYQLVQQVVRRRPDGVLFDYVRYPRGLGGASVVSKVQDLWIYSEAARQALEQRALNKKGRELIKRYVAKGALSASDVDEVDKLYPDEGEPLWQGRTPPTQEEKKVLPSAAARRPLLQLELWRLSVAHALQGILDFVALAASPVQQQGIQTGLVFFPDGNQVVGEGYDSRLQPWDRFPTSAEWHPMSYAACGNADCIAALVQRVFKYAPPEAKVIPAIAGTWGQSISNRPSLEAQMSAIERAAPQVKGISHFAFSWQEPEIENLRKSCRWK
ncbi:hypothetical protein B7486_40935 [cyanobacterium TDX16]|nr:hypothetical protein B7486_40935 [cyanobacterium TDX16]